MDEQAPKYHLEFLKSPHHVALGLLTLGLGFLSAEVLPLIAGATLYTLGWVYLPDFKFFRGWVDRRHSSAKQAEEAQKVAEFVRRRESLLDSLNQRRRERYRTLALVCRDIESASADSPLASDDATTDPRLRKLDELMWTYLRLLGIEESLEKFLETERRENLPVLLQEAEAEVTRLNTDLQNLKAKGSSATLETKQRYLSSRMDRLEVLRKRAQRLEQAQENLALIASEQERLEQQIKLLRADAVATKNADTLTARIDATVQHLDQTNKWIAELDEFKDLVGDLPPTQQRVGYATGVTPPPIIQDVQAKTRPPVKQAQR